MPDTNLSTNETLFSNAVFAQQKGDLTAAISHYEQLLERDPEHIQALCNLAIIYKNRRNFTKALTLLNKAQAVDSNNIPVLLNFANLLTSIGTFTKAVELVRHGLTIDPNDAKLYNQLALTHEAMGDLDNALVYYKEAIKHDMKFVKAYNNLGVILYRKKRYSGAIEIFQMAKRIDPKNSGTLLNLGASLNKAKRFEEAKEILESGLEIDPNNTGLHTNLANVLNKLESHEEALKHHAVTLEREPKNPSAHANIAISYKNLERYEEAKKAFETALSLDPKSVNTHFDYATLLLLEGDLLKGFREYEWRFFKEEMQSLKANHVYIFEKPRFEMDMETEGKTLLLYGEQGFGDNIQMIRYVYLLKDRYPELSIKVHCRKELTKLFCSIDAIDDVYAREDAGVGSFDYQLSIMSLPYFFKSTIDTIPNTQLYMEATDALDLDVDLEKINIGLAWGGSNTNENHENRVLSLRAFLPILNHPRIQVYSLQVGDDAKEISRLGYKESQIIDLSSRLDDFSKTASAIDQMDLVISSDTSVAHLAGALGKETWVMLQKIPDWRWLTDGEESVWYESLRLFRQSDKGRWDDVYDGLFEALEASYDISLERV